MYAAELMTPTEKQEKKILRAIVGLVKTSENQLRIRRNKEILEKLEENDKVKEIK